MAKKVSSKLKSKAKRQAKKVAKKHPVLTFFILLIFVCVVVGGYYVYEKFYNKTDISGELSIHFLELGNEYAGDCIYVKAGDNDILIDAGSRASSVSTIDNYLKDYVLDGKLEYVIVTHADRDHIAGFSASNGIFDLYDCGLIIDFPRTEKDTDLYHTYIEKRNAEIAQGATHYNALQCYNYLDGASRVYNLADSVSLEILYNFYYENDASSENDYSVCFMIKHGDRKFLFTGDLEEKGEEYLVEYNAISNVDVYKAGHHGSNTSSSSDFLSVINPKIVVVTCVAGSVEYTQNLQNTFPTQNFINNVSKHTEKVYVTSQIEIEMGSDDKYHNKGQQKSLNGNVVVVSNADSEISVNCSANDLYLKDSEWYKNNREPATWWN